MTQLPVQFDKAPPPPVRLTERDRRIIESIHAYDGMMSLRQIDRLFFSGMARTQPRARMRKLCAHQYVSTPNVEQVHRVPHGETIYWLGPRGANLVASMHGLPLRGFPWRCRPRWSWIAHDLRVNQFRIAVLEACRLSPGLTLRSWIPESNFLACPDTIFFRDGRSLRKKRQVRPDGFFTIVAARDEKPHSKHPLAFLLEVDMATHSNPRFMREKVRAGVAYMKTEIFRRRFGLRFARWLVVTTGERRLANLLSATEKAGGSGQFYFTTFTQAEGANVLTDEIWRLAGQRELTRIIPDDRLKANSR